MFGRKKATPEIDDTKPPASDSPAAPPSADAANIPARPSQLRPQVRPAANQGTTMSATDMPATPPRPDMPKRNLDLPSGIRPAASPVAVPSNSAKPGQSSPDPKTLIVGRDIALNGEISTCNRLIVEGKVEAALSDCTSIEIAESGLFKGAAEVQEADIRGRFEGKLTVKGRLMVRSAGLITGEICYGQLEVECGGQVAGTVKSSSLS